MAMLNLVPVDGDCRRLSRAGVFLAAAAATSAGADISFTSIGMLTESNSYSRVTAVSADGTTVVGRSQNADGNTEAFRLKRSNGVMEGLGWLHFGLSAAQSVDGSGAAVVGNSGLRAYQLQEAFIWESEEAEMKPVGVESEYSSAWDISADGGVIVGEYGQFPEHAFIADRFGNVQTLGSLGGGRSSARAVSLDGLVVAGWSDDAAYVPQAMIWDVSKGMRSLGTLGGMTSYATELNGDGSVVIGASQTLTAAEDGHAFRWTVETGMQDIHTLPHAFSIAWGVSADGSVIVGEVYDEPFIPSSAFIWDAENGMRDLFDVLTGAGVDLAGWTLARAKAISADGTVIVGDGLNPNGVYEGWIVTIPAPGAAPLLGVLAIGLRRRRR